MKSGWHRRRKITTTKTTHETGGVWNQGILQVRTGHDILPRYDEARGDKAAEQLVKDKPKALSSGRPQRLHAEPSGFDCQGMWRALSVDATLCLTSPALPVNKNRKNPFCVIKAIAFCANDMSFFLWASSRTKAYLIITVPPGLQPHKKKNQENILLSMTIKIYCCPQKKSV